MTTIVEKKIAQFNIIKIKSVQSEKLQHFVGKNAIDMTPDYYLNDDVAQEIVLYMIGDKSERYLSLNPDEISFEVVGFIEKEDPNIQKWGNVSALLDNGFEMKLENINQSAIFAGRTSRSFDLRYIQLTQTMLLGYSTIIPEDKFNTEQQLRFPNSDLYFFIKIGEVEGKSIYRYASDMVVRGDSSNIDWVLGVGQFTSNAKRITQSHKK